MNPTTTPNTAEFGFAHFLYQGDYVTHFVAILLLLMSIGSWFVIITKFIQIYRVKSLYIEVPSFWKMTSWQDAMNSLSKPNINPFYQIAQSAQQTLQERQSSMLGNHPIAKHVDLQDWLSSTLKRKMDRIIFELQKGLALLASTGATAPFIGLFGTVWGIYHALMVIGSSGSASLDQVAGPIGEALVMTGLGLAVAIPAVLGYNALAKSNRDLIQELRRFSDDVHTYFIQHQEI